MRINSVTFEGIHGLEKRHYEFNSLNYFVGPNGSGKSSAMNAIQLALLGYIPGQNKTPATIMKHSNTDRIHIILDTNMCRIERIWKKNLAGSCSLETRITPEEFNISEILSKIELPMYNFSEFLQMSANKMKDWFIQFVPKSESKIDLHSELLKLCDEDTTDIADDIMNEIDSSRECIDQIKDANTIIKSYISAVNADIKRINSTLQSFVHIDNVTVEDIDSLKCERENLNQMFVKCCKSDDARIQISKIEFRMKNIESSLKDLYDERDSIDKSVLNEDVKTQRDEIDKKFYDELSKIQSSQKTLSESGICPILNLVCGEVLNYKEAIKKELTELEKEHEITAKKKESITEIINIQKKYKDIEEDIKDLINNLNESIQERDDLFHKIIDESADSVKAKIDEVNDRITIQEVSKHQEEMSMSMLTERTKAERRLEILKAMKVLTDVNGLQTMLVKKSFEVVSDTVNEYLEKVFDSNTRCKFNIDSKSNGFSFGIERNSDYIEYDVLSSGEKAIFAIALMSAICKISDSEIKVVLIDDMLDHIDDDNLQKVSDSLVNMSDIQYIFAGIKPVENKNFNVIQVGK